MGKENRDGWVGEMAPSVKFLCNDDDPSLDAEHVHHHMLVIPTREAERQMLESYRLDSLTASVNSSFRERPCLKQKVKSS